MRVRTILLLLVSVFFSACRSEIGVSGSEGQNGTETQANPSQLSFTTIELKRRGGENCPEEASADPETTAADTALEDAPLCATVLLSYPKMSSSVNPELAQTINDFIRQKMLDQPDPGAGAEPAYENLEEFAQSFINDYTQDPNPFTSWEMEKRISVAFSTPAILTLLLEEYGYTGGAHPYSGARYSVLSLRDGSPVVLADLMNPGYETPLTVAGEKAFRQARNLTEADSLEEQGFSFEGNVFTLNENFGILRNGLDFIFNSYEIAPYAMGPTQFTIPYEEIHALIRPDGPLGSAEQQTETTQ